MIESTEFRSFTIEVEDDTKDASYGKTKDQLRDELNQRVREFIANRGKIQEIPSGVSSDEYGVTINEKGEPVSGHDGIEWHSGSHRWQVFAGKSRKRPVGFADTVTEGLRLQRRFNKKMKSKVE